MSGVAPGRRGPITAGLLLATFIITIDGTVVIIAIPHMQGNLSASPEQITWVLTAFIVTSAVTMPLSGWLAGRFGVKTVVLSAISLFTLASLLCGIATSLPEMVFLRMLQGACGAPIAPLAQAVLLNINPPERFGRAMAVFSMAAVAGPVVGPVIGGWLTDQLSWRWCFYINLPAGIASLLLLWRFLPNEARRPRRFDFLGFGALALAVGGLQLVLDRGTSQDWFNSREIWVEATVAVVGLWVYVTHTLTAEHPLFHPALARDRNFVTASCITVFFSTQLLASVALLPQMTQGVLGYSVTLSSLVSIPRGMVILIVLQLIGRMDGLVDRRLTLAFGMSVLVVSFWQMSHFDLAMGPQTIVTASIVQGIAQGFMSVPLTTVALATLAPELRPDGSSINNLVRSVSSSAGISMMQALTIFNGQRMHASLAEHVRLDDPIVRAGLPAALSPDTLQGALRLNDEITRQAAMVSFVDAFRLMAILTLCAAPLLLLLRNSQPGLRRPA